MWKRIFFIIGDWCATKKVCLTEQKLTFITQKKKTLQTSEEDQFGLGALIGEGAFGKTFECFDKKDGKKKIKLRKLSKDYRNLAETEASRLTGLSNENILHAVTAYHEKKTLYTVTGSCGQRDLARFVVGKKGQSLDEQRIVEWFRQIISALEHLHRRNVLHRDIKTQSVFLTDKEMTPKLGISGITKMIESPIQKVLSFRGSPYFMNPQLSARKPYHSKLSSLPEGYSPELNETIERLTCRHTDRWPLALELLQNVLFKRHSGSKVQRLIPNRKTPQKKLSTYKDLDKINSDTTLRINASKALLAPKYDSYLSSGSAVSNTKTYEASTLDIEPSKASDTEDPNKNYFEKPKTAEKDRYAFQLPLYYTYKIMLSLFGYFTRILMLGGVGSLVMLCTTDLEECCGLLSRKGNGRQPYTNSDKKSLNSDWRFWDKDLPNEKHLYEYFWKRHSVFSQWYPCKFTVDEIPYTSAEQYMMHQKAVLMDDKESARIILALNEPAKIKKVGRNVQNFNQELWESRCVDVVEKGNMEKFSQNEELKKKLFDTYPNTLVEASPKDTIWGIGLSEKDRRAWNRETWRGQNLLGEILTNVRDKLLELEPVPVPSCGTSKAENGLEQQSD